MYFMLDQYTLIFVKSGDLSLLRATPVSLDKQAQAGQQCIATFFQACVNSQGDE